MTRTKADKPKDKLLQGDIADALGIRASTIKYYTQLGLLPYESNGRGTNRYYRIDQVKPVLADIKRLKSKGYSMTQIVAKYAKAGKLAHWVDITLLNLTKLSNEKGENKND